MTLIPLFLLIFLSILFLGHYLVYISVLHFFGTAAFDHRLALALVLLLLAVSFVASMFLARWKSGLLARVVYFCSSLWLGVGLTLLTAFALAWTGWGIATVINQDPPALWFGAAAVGLAFLYSAYGVWNAYHPRIVNHRVRIKNLPAPWQGKKLVQLSDIHLGRILGAPFLSRIVDQVNAQQPAMVLITGDLFDGADGNLDQKVAPLNRLKAPQGTFFVTGNHETYLGVDRAFEALRTTPVKILDDEVATVDGLQVVGISYPYRRNTPNFAERMAGLDGFDSSRPSVLLYHSPSQVAEAKAVGVSLQLSGHVHQGQLFPLQIVTRIVFGKYHHGLHTEGDYTLYTTSGTGLWGPTMRTGNHPEIVVIELESGNA